MVAFLYLVMSFQPASASLSTDLLAQLQAGSTSYSEAEMGFIAGGIDESSLLANAMTSLDYFLKEMQLSNKQKQQSPAKQIKTLQKQLAKRLKTPEPAATLADAIANGKYNAPLASLLLHLAATSQGLKDAPWPKDPKPAAGFFAATNPQRGAAILAATFLQSGDDRVSEEPELATRYLKISYLLDKASVFEEERLSREWYNRTHKLYGEKALLVGGYMAEAGAVRFPQLAQFGPLCFNFGILLSQAGDIPVAEKAPLMAALAKHTGEHRATLEKTLSTMTYNQAVSYYEAGEFSKAWGITQSMTADAQKDDLKNLKSVILEGLIEAQLTRGENADEAKAALEKLDPARYAEFGARLKQIAVKSSYESGDYAAALALAEEQVDTAQGKNNYLAVLQQLIAQMQGKKNFKAALQRLSSVKQGLVPAKTLSDMRYNTYAAWLDHNQEPQAQFPIYRRMLADKSLQLKDKERTSLQDGWGNAYYLLIEKKIADREFVEAESLSQEALKAVPNHANLLKQKDLIKTIMERIK